jgi:tyrosine decarboxylase/aspartate 1-decarboxylase
MAVTRHALFRAKALGLEPVIEPVMNILCLRMQDPKGIQRRLDEMGWKVSVAQNPPSLRLVVMPHVTSQSIDGMFDALETIMGDA